MIVTIFLKIVNFVFGSVFAFMPSWGLPDGLQIILGNAFGYMELFSGILPIYTIFSILFIILSFNLFLLVFKIIMGVVSIIRGGGSIGI